MYLRCLTGDRPHNWVQWLPWAEFCYNSSFETSLQTSQVAIKVVYGRDPPAMRPYSPGEAQMMERDEFPLEIRERLEQAQQHHKEFYDQ
jgi:hypothetical protein